MQVTSVGKVLLKQEVQRNTNKNTMERNVLNATNVASVLLKQET